MDLVNEYKQSKFFKDLSKEFPGDKIKFIPLARQLEKILFPKANCTVYNILIAGKDTKTYVNQNQIDEYEREAGIMGDNFLKEIAQEIKNNLLDDLFLFL